MAAYHGVADIEALLRAVGSGRGLDFSAGRPIPLAELEQHMDQTERVVNQRLAVRYKVPVTDPDAIELLRYICARLTAATVWRIIQGVTQPGESSKANEWERQANEILDRIVAGELGLGSAELAASNAVAGVRRDGPSGRIWSLWEAQW